MLYTLVYTSDGFTELDDFELHNLLAQARDKNKRLDITGMLCIPVKDLFRY
ncbi:MAG: hypothetical protein ACI85N_001696 [Gammaproteobacteria bacterium]|jgi:hypothetical protein